MTSHTKPSLLPICAVATGIAIYVVMDVLMKGLSIEFGVYNAMLWRSVLGAALVAIPFFTIHASWPERAVLHLHIWRGVIVSLMAFLFFWGLVRVPLAEAVALSFIAPLIALYFAAVMLKEKIGPRSIIASIVGFVGALIIVSGNFGNEFSDDVFWGIAAILFSALLYAYNLILQRKQALVAQPLEIAFFNHTVIATVYLLLAPFIADIPSLEAMPSLLAATLCGIASMLLISWAYGRAEARVLIPLEYSAFIWAALLGWLVFSEALTVTTIVGTLLIVGGCLLVSRQKTDRVEHIEPTAV
ncbi:MAG: DMT family transporter [Pseudomonadota bacterium]